MANIRRKHAPEAKAQIVLEMLKEEKPVSQLAAEHGMHPNVLRRWKTEAIRNLPQLFVDDRKGITKIKTEYEQKINELYAEVGKLSTYNTWLKKNLASQLTREQRIALIEREPAEIPLRIQGELLSLHRSGLYYHPIPPSPEELLLKRRIDEIYTLYPSFQ